MIKKYPWAIAPILTLFILFFHSFMSVSLALKIPVDPLPSWHSGTAKTAILEFVHQTTTQGNPSYIPPEERIATFDNDGTLWPEKPLIQGMFVLEGLKKMAETEPTLREKQPFKAALEGDIAYMKEAGEEAVMELLALIHGNQTQAQFESKVRAFFANNVHPTLNVPYTQLAYQPMIELITYLRNNGFQTWICSGGGIDFIRMISQPMYGIPPQQVIGSSLKKEFIEQEGTSELWRKAELGSFNDKTIKPVNLNLHIGKRPVFSAGNVRNGGDIAMLTYSQGNKYPSLQLLINHDDPEREFAYGESSNDSLNHAKQKGWQVISIKEDWKEVFRF